MEEKLNGFEEFEGMQMQAPSLSFGDPEPQVQAQVQAAPEPEKKEAEPEENGLSAEELKMVDDFVKKIDVANSTAVMNYGVGTQKKLAEFSEKTLSSVKTKDLGEVGNMISDLVADLKNFDITEEDKGFLGFFKKSGNRLQNIKIKYDSVEKNVEAVSNKLEEHQRTLMKDVAGLEQMYNMNLNYFRELSMYILAGKKKLKLLRETELVELQQKANRTGLAEDAQAAKDFASMCDRFEKKLYDLQISRTIALQTGPQIRMLQDADTVMAEKIQSTIVNTIPLWKNQMVIAIGVQHANDAAKAQREVSDATNALLKKNAEQLKIATVEAAKESERGIVDIDTIRNTNEMLITTMDEVLTIQKDGKEKRRAAEAELAQIEKQLKQKLMEAARS